MVTALSSTEAEFYAAIAGSKTILFLQSVLTDLSISPLAQHQSMKIINHVSKPNLVMHNFIQNAPYTFILHISKSKTGNTKVPSPCITSQESSIPQIILQNLLVGCYVCDMSDKLWDIIVNFYLYIILYLICTLPL